MDYGYFELDSVTIDYVFINFTTITSQVVKRSLLITVYENMLNKNISGDLLTMRFIPLLAEEKDDFSI